MSYFYCDKCGQALEFRAKPTGKYDHFTGTPSQDEWIVCPEWRPRLFGGNGHEWRYQGENPIDGVTPFGPDPGFYENPPRPPSVSP